MPGTLRRTRSILDFALASLLRRKGRNAALLAVYILVVFVAASLVFFTQAVKREAHQVLADAPGLVVQRTLAGRQDLVPLAWADWVRGLRGVRSVRPRWWGYYYDGAFGANFTVQASEDPALPAGSAQIGAGAARILRVKEGDLITLRGHDNLPLLLTVQRILPAESELVASDLLLLPREDFQSLFGLPQDQATDLAVEVANPRELPTLAAKIAERYPEARPILHSEILRTYDAIFDWRGGLLVAVLMIAVLCFAIFAWDRAAGLSAEERREIGILKSIGWETSDVLLLKLLEGLAISLTAFLTGCVLAYGHVFLFSAPLFEGALKGWSVLYPRYRLVPAVDAYQLSLLFLLAVVPYTAATLIPGWRAATVDPDAAMRS